MGIFKKEISDESVIVQTFQVIAQAIDVAAQTGMDKEENFKIGDMWALYFWTLKPFEKTSEQISPYAYSMLKHSPGSPLKTFNTTSFQAPSQLIFPIHPDDYELYVKVSMQVKDLLENQYLEIRSIDNNTWMQECGTQIEHVLRTNLPTLYTKSTPVVVFIMTLALRSILKDTHKLNAATVSKLRKSAFFYISMMVTSWHFKTEGKL